MLDYLFKIPIVDFDKEQVKIGDVYQFTFLIKKNISWFPAVEIIRTDLAKYCVEKGDKFEVENISVVNDTLVLQARCIKNPLPFLVVFSAIVAGSSVLLYIFGLQLQKVEKIISMPTSKILAYTGLIFGVAVGYKTILK